MTNESSRKVLTEEVAECGIGNMYEYCGNYAVIEISCKCIRGVGINRRTWKRKMPVAL